MKYDEIDQNYKNVLTFHDWAAGGKTAQLNDIAYTIIEPFDLDNYDTFGHLSLYQDNRFHFISNNPSQLQATDYFVTLSGSDVLSVYSDSLNTANEANIHLGIPTRKYAQGFGYDSSHII